MCCGPTCGGLDRILSHPFFCIPLANTVSRLAPVPPAWPHPNARASQIVPLQIFRIGQFFLVAVPSEFTTMGGRRLRNAVRAAIIAAGGPSDAVVVISGLSNSYSSYVTTFEEYQVWSAL